MNNQLNMWYTTQLVTQGQMNDFSQDIYYKNGFLTDSYLTGQGCIINLPTVTQVGGNVTLGAGSFRFPDTTLAYLQYTPPIVCNAPSSTVAVTGNGYIVAQYVVVPTTNSAYEYVFTCGYAFVTSLAANMVKIVGVTAGVIDQSQWGVFASTPAINDILPANAIYITRGIIDIHSNAALNGGNLIFTSNSGRMTSSWNVSPSSNNECGISLDSTNGMTIGAVNGQLTYPITMRMYMPIISGNAPYSIVQMSALGSYAYTSIGTTNGVSGSYGNCSASYADGGNGIYKPYVNITSASSATRYATFAVSPSGSVSNYTGYYSSHTNEIDAGHVAAQECYYVNSTGNMRATLYATNDAPTNSTASGISCDAGLRPYLMNALSGMVDGTRPIVVFGDFLFIDNTSSGYVKLPNGIYFQWFTTTLSTRASGTVNFPIAFPTTSMAIWANVQPTVGGGVNAGQGYEVVCTGIAPYTTGINYIFATSAAAGTNLSVIFFGIGR